MLERWNIRNTQKRRKEGKTQFKERKRRRAGIPNKKMRSSEHFELTKRETSAN
jgi:hypothetical protein